jgi:ATP-dependent exoDNAse (exonuclease V) alpha subunit
MKQFPVVAADARTIHKLQGRTLDCVVVASWDYTGNWIYVALSRVKPLNGLFLLMPLEHHKCKGMPHALRTL